MRPILELAQQNNVIHANGTVFALVPKAMSSAIKRVVADSMGIRDMRHVKRWRNSQIESSWFTVAVVRHPVERLRSYYVNRYQGTVRKVLSRAGLGHGASFDSFVRFQCETMADHALVPQVDRLQGLNAVVVRVEDSPWPLVQSWVTGLADLPMENPSTLPKPDVSSSTRALIEQTYAEDFKAYGYD